MLNLLVMKFWKVLQYDLLSLHVRESNLHNDAAKDR